MRNVTFNFPIFRILKYSLMYFFIFSNSIFSDSFQLIDSEQDYLLGFDLFILADTKNEFTPEEILRGVKDEQFTKSNSLTPSYGFKSFVYWVKIDIKNTSSFPRWILEVGFPIISSVGLFMLDDSGNITKDYAGLQFPFHQRKIANRKFLFPIEIPQNSIKKILFRFENKGIMNIPIRIYTEKFFYENDHLEYFYYSLYYGIMIAMILYNLFLFLSVRDVTNVYYSVFLLFSGLYFFSQNGLGFEYLWSDFPEFALRINQLAMSYSLIFAIIYAYYFLNCKEVFPKIKKILIPMGILTFILTSNLYFSDKYYQVSGILISSMAIIVILTIFTISVRAYQVGYKPAIYFLISSAALFLGGLLFSFRTFGWIESNFITNNSVQIGSMLEAILLSFGLADRINILKREKTIAEATAKAKSIFFAMMSHEIRTPMNGVIGMAELLEKTNLDHKQKELLHIIKESGNSLLTIINDILDYTKIESEKIEFKKEVFELEKFLQESVDFFMEQAKTKKIDLYYGMDVQVPKFIICDKIRLRQILFNLINNSIKFTDEGEITVYAKFLENKNEMFTLEFSVQDSGIGIPLEQRDTLFEPFTQLDSSSTRKFGGTGLGLAICTKLVHLMNGNIWIDPKTKKGTKIIFTIQVPIAPADESKIQVQFQDTEENYIDFAKRKDIKILIADDSSINQVVLQEMLINFGFESEIVNNGLEVLAAVKQKEYDIIFMDIYMPFMDGLVTTKTIRSLIFKNPPFIIAMTANAATQDREECLNAGMNDYISKPVELEVLKLKTLYWSRKAINKKLSS